MSFSRRNSYAVVVRALGQEGAVPRAISQPDIDIQVSDSLNEFLKTATLSSHFGTGKHASPSLHDAEQSNFMRADSRNPEFLVWWLCGYVIRDLFHVFSPSERC